MNILAETMTAIEQEQFAAQMNLAPGTRAFRRMLRGHSLFRQLSASAREHSAAIVARIETIGAIEIDGRYENPFDVALSAYMTALSDSAGPEFTSRAARAVLNTPNCWWSLGIAREALLQTVASGPIAVPNDRLELIHVND